MWRALSATLIFAADTERARSRMPVVWSTLEQARQAIDFACS
jgi:hypothetical protein